MTSDDMARKMREMAAAVQRPTDGNYHLMVSPRQYWSLISTTVADPYERMKMLYNAGARGRDLAR